MPEPKWHLLHEKELAHDKYLTVYQNDYVLPGGKRLEGYLALAEQSSVHIVALTPERHVLLTRQYRLSVDDYMYEIPAGFLEEGESHPLERAKRELSEETGYETEIWHELGVVHTAVNRMRKRSYCFLALDVRQVADQHLDSTEAVEFRRFPLAEVRRMVDRGELTSASTLGALYKAILRLERLDAGA